VNPRSGDADEPDPAPLDSYQKRFPSELVSVAWAHPNRRTWVWVIASTDPARTTAALASQPAGLVVIVPWLAPASG